MSSPSPFRAGRSAPVRHAGGAAVRLRLPRAHSLALPRRLGFDRAADRPVAVHDAARRRGGVAVDHHHGGSHRPQMDAPRRRRPDGAGRHRVPVHRRLLAAARRRHDWRHQPQWQRGRAVFGHRTGGAGPGGDGGAAHRRLRLVQPDRLVGDGLRLAALRPDRPGPARSRRLLLFAELPHRPMGLCRGWRGPRGPVPAAVTGGRGARRP